MNSKKLLIWVAAFVILIGVMQLTGKKDNGGSGGSGAFTAETNKENYSQGQEVILELKNDTDRQISLTIPCPKNPFKVLMFSDSQFKEKTAETKTDCKTIQTAVLLGAGKKQSVTYAYWNHQLFGDIGRYKIEIPVNLEGKEQVMSTPEFSVGKRGVLGAAWDTFFYQPLFNLLILLASAIPFKDLGFAIILLTIIIRLILLVPSQRAIQAQKRMQEVQPKLDAIKKKHAGNQELIAKETMEIWKKEKVNPFGSCLPILIQFPVLIALYYVIRNGINPDNAYLLYGSLKNIDFLSIHTIFLGILDLTRINVFVLPLIVGLLQFLQMKMTFVKKPADAGKGSEMQQANQMMTYVMPVMIAVFTASVPAGVGLYWGVSTLFGIGQQMAANRKRATGDE